MLSKEIQIKINMQAIIDLVNLHGMSLDTVIDEVLSVYRYQMKEIGTLMLNNQKYPIEYKMGNQTLKIHKDGSRDIIKDYV